MRWLRSRTAVVAVVGLVAVLTIALGTWQGWLAQAAPGTVYVNDNLLPDVEGCNAPDAATIAAGITAADPGDTVVVCEGTYAGDVTVNKSVTIEGRAEANRADIVVEGASDGFNVTADGVTIRHITFDGPGADYGIHVTGDNARIEDVEAVEWDVGIYLDASNSSVVDSSEVDDNGTVGISASGGGDNEITHNVAGANNFRGVIVEDEYVDLVADNVLSGSDAALFLDADGATLLNVHVVRNTINAGSDGIFIDQIDSADSLIVIGGRAQDANTFAGSPTAPDYFVELTNGSENTVDATYNYWAGINVSDDIADLIYDDEVQNEAGGAAGGVVFHPWATQPAPSPSPSPTPSPTPSATPSPTATATVVPTTRDVDLSPAGWHNFVWTGANGTAAATALDCIGAGNYSIAYYWGGPLEGWSRYVPGRCDVTGLCSLVTVDKYDNLMILITASGVQCEDMPVDP